MNKYRGFEILWFEEDDSFDVVKIDEPLLLCKNMSTVEDCLRKIDEYWGDDDGEFWWHEV